MAKVQDNNIFITKGDKAAFNFEVEDYDFSSDTVTLGVKRNYQDSECVIVKEIENGKFVINPEDTAGLPAGVYFYDVKVVGENVDCTAIAGAQFVIGNSVFAGE